MEVKRDSIVKGLELRKHSKGASYYLYYRTKSGQERRPKICDGGLGLPTARKIARKLLEEVYAGNDPKGSWDMARHEITLKELFLKTYEGHWSDERYVKSGYQAEVKNIFESKIYPHFKDIKVSQVTRSEVMQWHNGMKSTPIMANRSLSVLQRVFQYGEEYSLTNAINPVRGIKKFTEKKRKTFASKEELKALLSILQRDLETNRNSVCFIYLLMFTGSRPSAIEEGLKEDLIKLESGDYLLSFNGKTTASTGDQEEIVIPSWIVDILPEGKTLTGCKMPRRYWAKVQEEIGNKDLWARDLRRTFATIGLSEGVSLGVIGEILNHKSTQTTKRYAKLIDDEKIKTSLAIANMIRGLND